MKKISFFSVIKSFIYTVSLLILIGIIGFVIYALTSFNHTKEEISYVDNAEIYKQDDISLFNMYFDNDSLYILIKTKKAQSNEYLLDYAYHYYFIYQTLTYLEVDNVDNIIYVNVNLEGVSTIV